VPWVETHSLSFSARHDSGLGEQAAAVLDDLERFRERLGGLFEATPGEVSVILHPRPALLDLAHPWLPLARMLAAPAARRYYAGWFSAGEIHVLSPPALEKRASGVEGSRDALLLASRHEYAHLVLGDANPDLPPPFTPLSFRRYARRAWLCEGAAAWLAGQARHLRAAVVRRLHEGQAPSFPPGARDAFLLGSTLFALLEEEAGPQAAVELALARESESDRVAVERAFERPAASVERDWREYLAELPR